MTISFDGQVAIVTGAGGGLGRAYALELGRRGAQVVVNDVGKVEGSDAFSADAVVREIVSAGGKAVASHDSVATPDGGKAIVDRARDAFGTVDIVIHNAGAWRNKPFGEMTPDLLDSVLDVHLRGAFFVTQPAWSIMQAKGYGRIVLTSSSAGTFGRPAGSNYAAAKAAMLGMGRVMALDGAEHGIKVNCILPIAPFLKANLYPGLDDYLGKIGFTAKNTGPDRIAPMVLFLASKACNVSGKAYSAGGGRFGQVFIGVADGWLAPDGSNVTPEDIEAHFGEIEDTSHHEIPPTAYDEMRLIDVLRKRRG